MLTPLSWLKEFVDIKLPVEKLAQKLSAAGLTVEKWTKDEDDYILDPEITPNRPDWMSVMGVAREVAAVTNTHVIPARFDARRAKAGIYKDRSRVKLGMTIKIDFNLCPRFTAVIIRNVTVKQSSELVKERLRKVGLRPINNLVDATNYVMWETGSPLHVFDLDKIRGGQMTLTAAKGGEEFKSLDGLNYKLPAGAIIIKDLGRVIDLCGIKGGENSAVSNTTKNVLLVVPIYNGTAVRKTSQALGLRSEASAIFERGADPGNTINTLLKATEMIGGKPEGIIDLKEKEFEPWEVSVSHEKIERVLGITLLPKQVTTIFESLGLSVIARSEATRQSKEKIASHTLAMTTYEVKTPTFRNDIHIEEDLIEEVGRIIGYDNFPKTLPVAPTPTEKVAYAKDYDFEYEVKTILKSAGYSEIYTYSLGSEPGIKILNPISKDFEYLRPNLWGNLLKAVKLNQANFSKVKIYELGKQYGEKEEYCLTSATTGDKFLEIKGEVESLLKQFGVDYEIKPDISNNIFHPGRTAVIQSKNLVLGFVGEINPSLLGKHGIKGRVTGFTLNYDLLEKLAGKNKKYQPIPQYPPIIEDLTLTIPEGTLVGDVINKINATSKLIVNVELVSIHERNFSFRITYQDTTKNLTDAEIQPLRKKIASLRSQ